MKLVACASALSGYLAWVKLTNRQLNLKSVLGLLTHDPPWKDKTSFYKNVDAEEKMKS